MRYLAIDLGDKRTGLALGDDEMRIISPLKVIVAAAGEARLAAIMKAIEEHRPDALVVGLPLNMDGTEGERAKIAHAFAASLAERCDLPLHVQDERLTSYAADQKMARTGRTHGQKKQLRDALAAAEILGDFFDGLD
jgi:putative Holliday junction resolvase